MSSSMYKLRLWRRERVDTMWARRSGSSPKELPPKPLSSARRLLGVSPHAGALIRDEGQGEGRWVLQRNLQARLAAPRWTTGFHKAGSGGCMTTQVNLRERRMSDDNFWRAARRGGVRRGEHGAGAGEQRHHQRGRDRPPRHPADRRVARAARKSQRGSLRREAKLVERSGGCGAAAARSSLPPRSRSPPNSSGGGCRRRPSTSTSTAIMTRVARRAGVRRRPRGGAGGVARADADGSTLDMRSGRRAAEALGGRMCATGGGRRAAAAAAAAATAATAAGAF